MFNGTTEVMIRAARADTIRRFNAKPPIPNILMMTTEAGGTGLNITGANHLIITEPQRTPGAEKQVIGRVDRLSQSKQVRVYITKSSPLNPPLTITLRIVSLAKMILKARRYCRWYGKMTALLRYLSGP